MVRHHYFVAVHIMLLGAEMQVLIVRHRAGVGKRLPFQPPFQTSGNLVPVRRCMQNGLQLLTDHPNILEAAQSDGGLHNVVTEAVLEHSLKELCAVAVQLGNNEVLDLR